MKLVVLLSSLTLLFSCSSRYNSNILVKRGVPEDERPYEVTQEGYGLSQKVKSAFLKGYVLTGMTQTLVRFLWGPPDRELENGKVWEYTKNDGTLITRVFFVESEQKVLNQTRLIVDKLEGDRWGGSLPPTASE